ncbi:MAG: autophagy- protein 2 [Phylliscum demangeonii]|nr:MAG: autophagy- protein 2 [Phylliscum demangeonii]
MASYFLPSAFQKRLLRYALSRLELFDDDTLNLDNLDIAWGKRSSVELREIGLKLKKVASLLRLPRWLELLRARVILLRITVPADIYNSSIIIEIEGVEVKARLPSRIEHEPLDPARSTTGDQHHEGAGAPYAGKASKGPPSFDQLAAESEDRSDPDDTDVDKIAFPTTVDLATSFLEAEPVTERARLEAEIASRYADPRSFPPSSDRDAEDDPSGTGTGLSLPGFLSSFLQGINDRMQAKVKDVQLAVDVDLQNDAAVVSSPATKSDLVTIQLRVKEIDIAKATHVPGQDEALQANFDAPDPSASRKSPVQDKGRQGCIARPIAIRDLFAVIGPSISKHGPSECYIGHIGHEA